MHRALECCVGIGHIEVERRRQRFTVPGELRRAAADHQLRIADLHVGMHAARGADHPRSFHGGERARGELDQRRRVVDDDVRRDGVEALAPERTL